MAGRKSAAVVALEKAQEETNQKVDQTIEVVSDLAENISKLTESVNEIKEAPAVIRRHMESEDQELGGVTGNAEFDDHAEEQQLVQPVEADPDNPGFKEKMDNIGWNEGLVEVHVHETSDKDAEKIFEIAVGGERCLFRRDETKKVKRKFVEGLARAKPVSYSNEEYMGEDGKQHVRYPSHKGLRYPFSLVDPSPKDKAWLQAILAQQ